eukprot:TRINITY_DN9674_c0_g1_i1.p1 TRINITY_DN9674_c0_g1~~TRINITY_DN9674_c0_g1_i1.p1  ORF type:complete len:2562 (+),score=794.22 TRINITY_DN9674_c0_g1_i1:50-7735(+)
MKGRRKAGAGAALRLVLVAGLGSAQQIEYLPVCPASSALTPQRVHVPSGEPCVAVDQGAERACQNVMLEVPEGYALAADPVRRCWLDPLDGDPNQYVDPASAARSCQQAGTLPEGASCWLYPATGTASAAEPADGQCRQGLFCWADAQPSQFVGGNVTVTLPPAAQRGHCRPKLANGAGCSFHAACASGACVEISSGVRHCAPRAALSLSCAANEECVVPPASPTGLGTCQGGVCVDVFQLDGGTCGAAQRCRNGVECQGGACVTKQQGATCNKNAAPNGGCSAMLRCIDVTNAVTLVTTTQCDPIAPLGGTCAADTDCGVLLDRACDIEAGQLQGVCRRLASVVAGAYTHEARFCRAGLFLDTTGTRFFCAHTTACTADSQCAVAGQAAYGFCACPDGALIGSCRVAGGGDGRESCAQAYLDDVAGAFAMSASPTQSLAPAGANATLSPTLSPTGAPASLTSTAAAIAAVTDARRRLMCCLASAPATTCSSAWMNDTVLFGGDIVGETEEPSAVWCGERCRLSRCESWTYDVLADGTGRRCVLRRGRVWGTPQIGGTSRITTQAGCTAAMSAFDFTVPGMKELCPERLQAPPLPRPLIARLQHRAQPHLPYVLRVNASLVSNADAAAAVWSSPQLDFAALYAQRRIPKPAVGGVLTLPAGLLRGGDVYRFSVEVAGEVSEVQPVIVNAPPRLIASAAGDDYAALTGSPLTGTLAVDVCAAAAVDDDPGDNPLTFRLYCGAQLWMASPVCSFVAVGPRQGDACRACVADSHGAENCVASAGRPAMGASPATAAELEAAGAVLAQRVTDALPLEPLTAASLLAPLAAIATLAPSTRPSAVAAARNCTELTPATTGQHPPAAHDAAQHILRALAELGGSDAAAAAAALLRRISAEGVRLTPLETQLAADVLRSSGPPTAAIYAAGGLAAEMRYGALLNALPQEAGLVVATETVVLRYQRGPLGQVGTDTDRALVRLPLPYPSGDRLDVYLPLAAVLTAAAEANITGITADTEVDFVASAVRAQPASAAGSPWAASALFWAAGAPASAAPLPLGAPAAFGPLGATWQYLREPDYVFRVVMPVVRAPTTLSFEARWGGGELVLVTVLPPGANVSARANGGFESIPPIAGLVDRLAEAAGVLAQRVSVVENRTVPAGMDLLLYIAEAGEFAGISSREAVDRIAVAAEEAVEWRRVRSMPTGVTLTETHPTFTRVPTPTLSVTAALERAEVEARTPPPPEHITPALAAGLLAVRTDRRHGLAHSAAESLDECKVWPREAFREELACVWEGDASPVGCRVGWATPERVECQCAQLPVTALRVVTLPKPLPRDDAIGAFTDTRVISTHWLAPSVLGLLVVGSIIVILAGLLAERLRRAAERENETVVEFPDAQGLRVRLAGVGGALKLEVAGRPEGMVEAVTYDKFRRTFTLHGPGITIVPYCARSSLGSGSDSGHESPTGEREWGAKALMLQIADLCRQAKVPTNLRLTPEGEVSLDSPPGSPRSERSPRRDSFRSYGSLGLDEREISLLEGWRINHEIMQLSRADSAHVRAKRSGRVWDMLRAHHLWLSGLAAVSGLTQALNFRLHQRALVGCTMIFMVFIGNSFLHTRCDDWKWVWDIVVEYVWMAALTSFAITPGWYFFGVFFSQSPGVLRMHEGRTTPLVARLESQLRPVPKADIEPQQEMFRRRHVLQDEELDEIWQHEIEGGRLHTAVTVLLLLQLRMNAEAAKDFQIDIADALDQARAWWCVKRVEHGGASEFAARYNDEEQSAIWTTALKALAMHDFQLAAALFQCALLSENPDLWIVFNAQHEDRGPDWLPRAETTAPDANEPPQHCATPPPPTLHEAITRMVQRNTVGRIWVEYYARTFLSMVGEDVYRALLHSFVTADDVLAVLGCAHNDVIHGSWGPRAAMFCEGQVDTWQEGVRALTDVPDDSFPDLVEAAQIFCWAPQELCSYLLHNTTAITGPLGDTMKEIRNVADENSGVRFKPKPLMYGRLMARYYCCVLSRLPGSRISNAKLTPQEFAVLLVGQERDGLLPEVPYRRRKGLRLPFVAPPKKRPYRPNAFLSRLLNWKLGAVDRPGIIYARSPLLGTHHFAADQLLPLTRLSSLWHIEGTGSKISPFVGLEAALPHLKQGDHVCLVGGRYPPCRLFGLRSTPLKPVVIFSDPEQTGTDRQLIPGARVRRNPDQWHGPDIDGGPGGLGTVMEVADGRATVDWDSGARGEHSWGVGGDWALVVLPAVPVFGWANRAVPPAREIPVDPFLNLSNCHDVVISGCHFRWGSFGVFAPTSHSIAVVRCSFEHLQLPTVHSADDQHNQLFDVSNTVSESGFRGSVVSALRYTVFEYWGNYVGYALCFVFWAFALWITVPAALDMSLRQGCAWVLLCACSLLQDLLINQPLRLLVAWTWAKLQRTGCCRRQRGLRDTIKAVRLRRKMRAQSILARAGAPAQHSTVQTAAAGLLSALEDVRGQPRRRSGNEGTQTTLTEGGSDAVRPIKRERLHVAFELAERPKLTFQVPEPAAAPSAPDVSEVPTDTEGLSGTAVSPQQRARPSAAGEGPVTAFESADD